MAALYLVSAHALAGKTAVGAAVGLWLQSQGRRVGYLKPISVHGGPPGAAAETATDGDAVFMKQALGLAEPAKELVGLTLSAELLQNVLKGQAGDYRTQVRKAYDWVARGKDNVILEGPHALEEGAAVGLPPTEVVRLLDARALLVLRYSNELALDDVLATREAIGPRLAGVLINAVTPSRLEYARETLVPFLIDKGVQVIGLVPQQRDLLAVSVGELADTLKGEVITAPERREELVREVMIGTMSMDSAYDYFRRKSDKAVIVTADRPDLAIAALQTSTRCLIVCGHLPPNPIVLARAEELEVPLIMVRRTTLAAVETVEEVFGQVRFQQRRKLATMSALLREHVDLEVLRNAL